MLKKLTAVIASSLILALLVGCGEKYNDVNSPEDKENTSALGGAVADGNETAGDNASENDNGNIEENVPASSGNKEETNTDQPEQEPTSEPETEPKPGSLPALGTDIGNLAPTMSLVKLDGGAVNTADFAGKVVVINVWGTWCPPCRNELPDFDRIASEYDGEVVVLAVHSNSGRNNVPGYVETNFPDSKIVFAYDTVSDDYHALIGGTIYYPRTVILDERGVITYAADGAISYDYLKYLVNNAGADN